MSEPLSSVEIEDVLSSIRRLVSEDLRPVGRGSGGGAASAVRDAQKQALILTPALRVVSEPEAMPEPEPEPVLETSIEDVVASVGAAVGERPEDWESETGDAALEVDSPWDEAVWAAPGDDLADADRDMPEVPGPDLYEADLANADLADADFPDSELPASDVPASLLPTADLSAADLQNSEYLTEALADPKIATGDIVTGEPDAADAPGWAQVGADETFVFHSRLAPERRTADADAGWADQAEADVIAELEPTEADDGPDGRFEGAPELTFDEEVLRDLVRDLIREELQGHLGERITRNIRKLVRAEIARALAASEFD